MPADLVIWDDPVTPAPAAAKVTEWCERLNIGPAADFTSGGAYRNRFGQLVTWDATADGSYVQMQTWPGE